MQTKEFFELLNNYYWSTIQPIQDRDGIWEYKVDALRHFVRHYIFQRRGGEEYTSIAVAAIDDNRDALADARSWDSQLQEKLSTDFGRWCTQADIKRNPRLDPFSPGEASLLAVLSPSAIGDQTIASWARQLIRSGDLKKARDHLEKIRGVASKISAFYMRDISLLMRPRPCVAADRRQFLQPIDIWTERAADVLAKHDPAYIVPKRRNPAKRRVRAAQILTFEVDNKLQTGQANLGFWVIGARFAQSASEFEAVVREIKGGSGCPRLSRLLKDELKIAEERLDVLRSLIRTVSDY
ncbi:MAG: hypothetical protein DME33_14010 [Verrucomicrobia bacterium]|nr:MAG: hypothetical protein DME33_14010 [Verrucomicrobiota bacterium]